MNILPWQHQQWHHVLTQIEQNRLPHALLLTGADGLGKHQFATHVAKVLLCESTTGDACGSCAACLLFAANNHPDLIFIQPEEKQKNIKVDQIRQLVNQLQKTSQYGGYQVVILDPAEAMNVAAANALLKTLEEPQGQVVLLLVSHTPASLLATIRSRCQLVHFNVPAGDFSLPWLQAQLMPNIDANLLLSLADGSPLRAVALADEELMKQRQLLLTKLIKISDQEAQAVNIASDIVACPLDQVLQFLLTIVMDLIRLHFSDENNHLINRDCFHILSALGQNIQLLALYEMFDYIIEIKKLLHNQAHLNVQLQMENIVMRWFQLRGNNHGK